MDIIVEVGTPEQKEIISKEAEILRFVSQNLDPPIFITRLIVPENFDDKVNEIEGTSSYKANRGLVHALARICEDGDGYAIIVSPILYTESFDTLIRYFIFLHEFTHVLNRRDFPPISTDIRTNLFYSYSLYHMYDEYYADRFAFKLSNAAFPVKSQLWINYYTSMIQGYKDLITNPSHYEKIKAEIMAFRYHADVDEFLKKIHVYYDPIAIVLAHTFAIYHECPEMITKDELVKSKFVNEKTFNLMNYFSKKYADRSVDLTDGNDLIIEFLTNFGIKFEERESGTYCHVLDI